MKVIIISNFIHLKNRPDKLDYLFLDHLKQVSKYKIILCENNESSLKKNIMNDDIIILFNWPYCKSDYIKQYNNKKIFWIYDINCTCKYGCNGLKDRCGFQEQYKYINENDIQHVWYKYETPITLRLAKENKYWVKFQHMMFNNKNNINYQIEKKYDILFFGATYPGAYPFRNRLYYLLKKNTDKFNILFLPYTKKHPEKMITGIDLYKLISQSWLTCACCLISNILVAKYYEIGLYGSVALGDYPEYETELYLKDNMIYINRHMDDNEIINIIQNALNHKDKLLKYSSNTKRYISENYMYKNGLKTFENHIQLL